jgi:predicted DNA-binding transcriptional regulator YafY
MRSVPGRKDRTARLLKEQIILWQHPEGLKIEDLARSCSVSTKTAYRDLAALESELSVPIWGDGSKRGIMEGYFLPPINFTLNEAMNIFIAARLFKNITAMRNPDVISMFMKLASVVPQPLRKHIQYTIDLLEKMPFSQRKLNNFNKIAQAWLTQHPVKVVYQESDKEPIEQVIDPYYIEPLASDHSNYVLAYSHERNMVCSFNMDLIVKEVETLPETFEIPADLDLSRYIDEVMHVYTTDKLETVKLHFKPRMSRVILNKGWSLDQETEVLKDGSSIVTFKVRNNMYFRGWILGFGDDVEVISPEVIRSQIARIVRSLSASYGCSESKARSMTDRRPEMKTDPGGKAGKSGRADRVSRSIHPYPDNR